MWSLWNEIVIGITTPDFSCEIEKSCNVKLARTMGKVGGRSGVDVGSSSPFCVGFEFIYDVEREGIDALEDPEGFLLQSFKTVERLMYNKTIIIARMMHHCIVPPIPPKMPWNMLPMPMVESLAACPVDFITLDAAFLKLFTTFSSRSPTAFKASWIAPPIAFIMELPSCAADYMVAPRALLIPNNVAPSPLSIWRSFSSCMASWTFEKISSIV